MPIYIVNYMTFDDDNYIQYDEYAFKTKEDARKHMMEIVDEYVNNKYLPFEYEEIEPDVIILSSVINGRKRKEYELHIVKYTLV